MHIPKKYFHDRLILLLFSINVFVTLTIALLITLKLSTSKGSRYIVEYRSNLGLNRFHSGKAFELISFILFAVLVFSFHLFLSLRTYSVRRHYAIVTLATGTLLLVLTAIVSNALLVLR